MKYRANTLTVSLDLTRWIKIKLRSLIDTSTEAHHFFPHFPVLYEARGHILFINIEWHN